MVRSGIASIVLSLVLLAAGCNGSGNGGTDGGEDAGPEESECGAAELVIVGTLNGEDVDERYPVGKYVLDNEQSAGYCFLNVYPDEGGRVRFEWPLTLGVGETSAASAMLTLDRLDGTNAGNCSADGYPSEITLLDNGVEFVLQNLYESPYCDAVALSGELRGCATFE